MTRTSKSNRNEQPTVAIPRAAIFMWRLQQWVLILAGVLLLALYGVARIEAVLASRFMVQQTDASASSVDHSAGVVSESHLQQADYGVAGSEKPASIAPAARGKLTPLAVVLIPSIHLTAPLLEGTDALTLNHALGRIPETARPGQRGNIGIAGHRDGVLRGLKDIKTGDVIQLARREQVDTYVVEQIRIVDPDQVDVLKPRLRPSLTFVTCYPFYFLGSAPKRFVVTASLTHR